MKSRTTILAMQIRGRETHLGNPLKKTPNKQKTSHQQSGWNTDSACISLPSLLISLKSSSVQTRFIVQRKANSNANINKEPGLTQEMERDRTLLETGYSWMIARIYHSCTHSLHWQFSIFMKHATQCSACGIRRQHLTSLLFWRRKVLFGCQKGKGAPKIIQMPSALQATLRSSLAALLHRGIREADRWLCRGEDCPATVCTAGPARLCSKHRSETRQKKIRRWSTLSSHCCLI